MTDDDMPTLELTPDELLNLQKLRQFVDARKRRDEAKSAAERAERVYRETESEVWASLKAAGIVGELKVELGEGYGVVGFAANETIYGKVIDKDKFNDFLKARAREEGMTEAKFSSARVNELANTYFQQNLPMPPGLDFNPRRYITVSFKDDGPLLTDA